MMKVVILAGGLGTRISEESHLKPKPMIEIGDKPILWHIMKLYSYYGFHEFIICAGYKQHVIKQWFADYFLYSSDITFDFTKKNEMIIHNNNLEPWKVSVIDTGLNTLTGGRIKAIQQYIGDEPFFLTYGDGVADVNIAKLLEFHKSHNCFVTMTGIKPEGRFGVMELDGNRMNAFREKHSADTGWINGGFMVLEPEVFEYIKSDAMFEYEPLESLARDKQVMCYKHYGFWQCMDTKRDKEKLEKMWESNKAPWKIWDK